MIARKLSLELRNESQACSKDILQKQEFKSPKILRRKSTEDTIGSFDEEFNFEKKKYGSSLSFIGDEDDKLCMSELLFSPMICGQVGNIGKKLDFSLLKEKNLQMENLQTRIKSKTLPNLDIIDNKQQQQSIRQKRFSIDEGQQVKRQIKLKQLIMNSSAADTVLNLAIKKVTKKCIQKLSPVNLLTVAALSKLIPLLLKRKKKQNSNIDENNNNNENNNMDKKDNKNKIQTEQNNFKE